MISSMYEKVKDRVSSIVQVQHGISITTDIWSSDSLDSYLSFTYRLTHGFRGDTEYTRVWLLYRPWAV